MRSSIRLGLLAVAGAVLVSGCALRDPRDSYAYGRSDGLWDADYDLLLDWNFPTTANQGPLLPPTRFKPVPPAIGVPWATGNPMVPRDAAQAPSAAATGDASAAVAADDANAETTAHDEASSTMHDATLATAGVVAAGDARVAARLDTDPGR
jgi:hypothetical protein